MLDAVCRRYPGRRPSDYMELNEFDGFQFDSALAIKYHLQEQDLELSKLDAIMDGIANICRGLGMKVSKSKRKPLIKKQESKPLAQVVSELGGPGVVVEKIKKKK